MALHLDKYFTSLDEDLRNLAAMDWSTFAIIIGEEAILCAKICLLRSRGNSLQQIANRLEITKNQVQYCIKNKYERFQNKEK